MPGDTIIRIGDLELTTVEAEETLTAIREGSVDAVVVHREGEPHVYTLRDADHPFRFLVEKMETGAALVTDGGMITYANAAFERLTGRQGLRGTFLREILGRDANAGDELLEVARLKGAARGELGLPGADGGATPILLSVSSSLLDDLPVFCVVATDLSAQREIEARYRAAREAIEARDRLVSIASHELRNPLAAMALNLALATRAARTASDETSWPGAGAVLAALERADRQGVLLGNLIERLLETARTSSGPLDLTLEELDLADVVKSTVERLEAEISASGCEVALDLRPASGRWDRVRLEQVVTNLVTNAVKYGRGKPIEVSVASDARRARLTVRDHGIGIPGEAARRIFLPFERIHQDVAPGLGLGLYIAREIVTAHGGEIAVDTSVGDGARFVVSLPRTPPQA